MQTNIDDADDRQILSGIALQVLDHGFVRVVDKMGDDQAVIQAHSCSIGHGHGKPHEDVEMVNRLMRQRITPEFEMCVIKLHVKVPIFVAGQWPQARGTKVCYSTAASEHLYMPEPERIKDMTIQQAFSNLCVSVQSVCTQALEYGDKHGVPHDINRINWIAARYMEFYWCANLVDLMAFLRSAMAETANEELRAYADVVARIMQAWVPVVFGAFMIHDFHSASFSVKEQEVLAPIAYGLLSAIKKDGSACPPDFAQDEWADFLNKLASIAELHNENIAA